VNAQVAIISYLARLGQTLHLGHYCIRINPRKMRPEGILKNSPADAGHGDYGLDGVGLVHDEHGVQEVGGLQVDAAGGRALPFSGHRMRISSVKSMTMFNCGWVRLLLSLLLYMSILLLLLLLLLLLSRI